MFTRWVSVCGERSVMVCGIAVCCVVYAAMFMFVPSVVNTLSLTELSESYARLHKSAEKLSRDISMVNMFNPTKIMDRMREYDKLLNRSRLQDNLHFPGECSFSLDRYSEALANGTLWALKMTDASSKIHSGILEGNLYDLGAYDECVDIDVQSDSYQFYGQHCLVVLKVNFKTPPNIGDPGVLAVLGNALAYTFSLCFPSSCSPESLSYSLHKMADEINSIMSGNTTIEFVVQDSDCHTQIRPPLEFGEVFGIVVTGGFLALVAICTIIDLTLTFNDKFPSRTDLPKCIRVLIAFSLYTNGKRLLDTEKAEGTIQELHCLKFLSIAWVAVGHRIRFTVAAPLANLLKLADLLERWQIMLILNATLSVDVFFVISGILNTYIYMNVSLRSGKSLLSHLMAYVHRYIRLTPAYALMILVTGTWLYRTGDGPLWDRLVGDAKTDCTGYWWSGLLYINNYYNPNDNCMMQSWYLAADMQLFWLSPLILYPLWRWPRVGHIKLVFLVILSIIVPFLVAYVDHIKTPIPISFDQEKVNREMAQLYFPTHTKTISYILGILGGYILHLVRANKLSINISRVTNMGLWALAIASMAGGLFGGHSLFLLDSTYSRWHSSLYIAFYRFFWSAGVVWIIIACTVGYGGIVSRILSWKVFMPLGRLTYCIYLTHVAVILYNMGSLRQPQYFTYHEQILKFLGEFVLATFFAAVLSLVVESPIMCLEKILLYPNRAKRRVSFSANAVARRSSSRQSGTPSRQCSNSHLA